MATPLNASLVNEKKKAEAVRKITDAARIVATIVVNNVAGLGEIDDDLFQKKVVESPDFDNAMHEALRPAIQSVLVAATRSWREKDGVIYLTLISDGTTGSQWVEMFPESPKWTRDVLLSPDFKPTKGVVYQVAILKGTLFSDNDRVTKKIRKYADDRKLTKPNAELACLIRKNFSNEDIEAMGLVWIVAMHDPIKDSGGVRRLLCADRDYSARDLDTADGHSGRRWFDDGGFAFLLSQDQDSVSVA